ncbi:MAG TPA: DUF2231 domain-containing protein [Candidatus Binataceae bacterium]|nr:DUF2231 domain-containing protein [Candidatus Binataceae bacterium]
MQPLIDNLKIWNLHPFVDHFTISLIVVAVLVELVASVMASRLWLRYMALTLLILGTAAAFGSMLTGEWTAHQVWHSVNGPAKELLSRHAWLGHRLPYLLAALVLWRLLIQFTGFAARSKPIYLAVVVITAGLILYQGFLGGDIVFDYGVGTALLQAATPSASLPTAPAVPPPAATPLPTVFVPTPTPAAAPTPATPTPAPSVTSSSATPAPASSPSVSAQPATPTPSGGDSSTKNL